MVREIIHFQVGQCGNQIGSVFWQTLMREHNIELGSGRFDSKKIDPNSKQGQALQEKVEVYFEESGGYVGNLRYVPRAILIDLEPSSLETIRSLPMAKNFRPDNFIFGSSGAGNNWAKGHYTDGAELIDEIVEVTRKETEKSDCPQGFQVTQSLGGGTGSGLGTLLLLKLRDGYPDRITSTYSVYPSPKVSDVVVEPYNAVLSIHQLLENSDETFVIDNEALYNISHNILKQNEPRYKDLNWVISLVMSGITASLRFSGKLNGDLRKLGVNLVPFPRLHFFTIAQAPLFGIGDGDKLKLTIHELTDQMWSGKNFLCNTKPENGKYMSASCGYRGDISTQEVEDELLQVQNKFNDDFVTWIPNNIKSDIVNVSSGITPISSTFVANTTAIKTVFQRIDTQFGRMYKRKAFLHWYKGEGMDEMEFQEADKNVRDLVTEYQDKQDAVVELDGDDEEAEDDDQQEEDE